MILVTILTPSFNQAQFIRATIDSVLSQDYANIEYFIVDGRSTDGTIEILKELNDPRVQWISEQDEGQSDAINKGLARATGEIITYINSDDLLLPGAVRFAVDYFTAHPQVDVLYGDGYYIDSNGKRLQAFPGESFDLTRAILGGQEWTQPGTFWRKSAGDRVGVFDTAMHYRFDFDYFLRMAFAGSRLDYAPGERAVYRLHAASKTISQIDRFMGDWHTLIDKIYARPDLPDTIRQLRPQVERYLQWHDAKGYWLKGDYSEARPRLWDFVREHNWGRRVMASTMLIDSYLNTPFTRLSAAIFKALTGSDVMTM